jgi:hypothetical protein
MLSTFVVVLSDMTFVINKTKRGKRHVYYFDTLRPLTTERITPGTATVDRRVTPILMFLFHEPIFQVQMYQAEHVQDINQSTESLPASGA